MNRVSVGYYRKESQSGVRVQPAAASGRCCCARGPGGARQQPSASGRARALCPEPGHARQSDTGRRARLRGRGARDDAGSPAAPQVLQDALDEGAAPSPRVWASLMVAFGRAGQARRALRPAAHSAPAFAERACATGVQGYAQVEHAAQRVPIARPTVCSPAQARGAASPSRPPSLCQCSDSAAPLALTCASLQSV